MRAGGVHGDKIDQRRVTPQASATELRRDDLLRLIPEKLVDILLSVVERHPDMMREIAEDVMRARKTSPSTEVPADGFMVGACDSMVGVFEKIRRFGRVDAPVLITGESGTGKDLAAKAIHERSAFCEGPFVAVNCSGLPENLVASELFGYERGSFTGAAERRIGRIEAANGGTLFLDEIGDMPMNIQPQLLRFLQEKKIQRIGGKEEIAVNVRVVAATNVELEQAVRKKLFRKDLFFRLNILRLDLPALRERHGDVPLFVHFLLQQLSAEHELPVPEITTPALNLLEAYSWPGNVRELISALRRAVIMCDEDRLNVKDFAFLDETESITPSNQHAASEASTSRRRKPTGQELQEVLALHHNNVSQTARYYGVSRVTLYTWLKMLK